MTMSEHGKTNIAVVGMGAILPDAPDAGAFWANVKRGRYSITDVSPSRWDPELYYDPDPAAPDKTYSKIGGWVQDWEWDPLGWKLPIPPKVSEAMDDAQKWAVACTRAALLDYGYPGRSLDEERTAVILGNAMAGERHYFTVLRILAPEYAEALAKSPSFIALPTEVRTAIASEALAEIGARLPRITEDTMPGELGNVLAGRVAALFNFRGPNFVTDAACGSALAAMSAAVRGLADGDYNVAVTGGIDRNMGVGAFVKFCKIGALSATGTRPYAEGADGFVMGEGAGVFLLKRLADAERDGDLVYAVIRSIAGSSDGKGRGITAPNPIGQRLAVERAWQLADEDPASAGLVEGHGTSTRVGDVVEVEALGEVFGRNGLAPGSIPLGSVKSNIGHLKAAAGAAGLLKTVLAVHEGVLPPSINFQRPNPDIDFSSSVFRVNTELQEWERPAGGVRRAGVSAFGFGGTNWHAVLEEHVPGRLDGGSKVLASGVELPAAADPRVPEAAVRTNGVAKAPLRGALVVGGTTVQEIEDRLERIRREAESGSAPEPTAPAAADLAAPERVAIDYADAAELAEKAGAALKALQGGIPATWKALQARGIFRGSGPAPKVAFLYPGQGSQYVNMLRDVAEVEPIVAETFAEADRVMTPLLGRPLTSYLFVDPADPAAVAAGEMDLMQTAITQPAVLAVDLALTRLLAAYGIEPDMVMGHSLGEYGALVAAGALTFEHALEAVSARGREMTNITVEDNGKMAAVIAPIEEVERILGGIEGYVVIANVNSSKQAVIGGASAAVDAAVETLTAAGFQAIPLPVSHAFHTSIVAPASEPLRAALIRLDLRPPRLPIVANVSGEFYPMGDHVLDGMLDVLARQVASPVQFVKGMHTLYAAGARAFVEVGPKKALRSFAEDVIGGHEDVNSVFTNHPKVGGVASFNQALCGLYAAGLGTGVEAAPAASAAVSSGRQAEQLEQLFSEFVDRARRIYQADRPAADGGAPLATERPVVITGAALGLPGTQRVFDDANVGRILRGEQFIDVLPSYVRRAILDKHVTRLVKREDGDPTFEVIEDPSEVIKLAGRGAPLDLEEEFGVPAERLPALDRATQLAMGAGLDALRDAGIPLIMRYRTTSKGTKLPERWELPEALRDDTAVIFASAFPAYDSFAQYLNDYHQDRARREQVRALREVRARAVEGNGGGVVVAELDRRIHDLEAEIERTPFRFDRRFLFKALSMGHAQFAELVGARGPNTQMNSACASTTQAIAMAEDWIRLGRCRRVVVIAADDATSDNLMEWIGAGFLASGAAATDEVVEDAATPFDRRRHGMIIGMGAAALVVESAEAAAERGIRPICEVLAATSANSAFHGTRLDVEHISGVMEDLVGSAERRWGIRREEIAPEMVFVSHETYTPARGGSAAAEVHALRSVFGAGTDRIVVANTKGFTGHAMGVGIEDVVAVKSLETGVVPPVPNYREVDPELGTLNLSLGGVYPVRYALRLAAGFGSQIAMTLLRWVSSPDGFRRPADALGYEYRIADRAAWDQWVRRISGRGDPHLEVVRRTLRVTEEAPAAKPERPRPEAVPTPEPEVVPALEAVPTPVVMVEALPAPEPAPQASPAPVATLVEAPPDAQPAVEVIPARGALDESAVREAVLALVAESTGYPTELLDPELDMEADLGVDTVKQAEIFASIRQRYDIPRDDTLKLRDFPTLAHVVQFVLDRTPAPETIAVRTRPAGLSEAEARDAVLALVAEETGYPTDLLDLDLDLEADLGVDTVKQAEIFASIRQRYGIDRDDALKLRDFPTLAHVIGFVLDRAGGGEAATEPSTEPAATELSTEPVGEGQPPEAAQAGTTEDEVRERVLALAAENTGYPVDLLGLDLDLEADLGIDTVKQAEIFASIRQSYGIARDDDLKLRDFPTLGHVIQFVLDRAPQPDGPPPDGPGQGGGAPETAEANETAPDVGYDPVRATAGLDAANAVPRREPTPVLRPPLDSLPPTGVALGPGDRVVVMPDRGGVATELTCALAGRGVEVLTLEPGRPAEELVSTIEGWAAQGPVAGVFWLPALDVEPPLASMDPVEWHEGVRVRVKLLAAAMRALYEQLDDPAHFLVSATRLGGMHGYDPVGAVAPMGGAVTGFTKALARERPDATVKAVDFESGADPAAIAAVLIEETLRDPGAVEVGRKGGLRWTIGLRDRPAGDPDGAGIALGPDTVFAVTGAAGSIVSAIIADLAGASGGAFHLLDLAPEPRPDDPDILRFRTDRDGLKRDLAERIRDAGERPTPTLIERRLAGIERADAALAAIEAIHAAGGTARYHQLDLRDPDAVAAAVGAIRAEHGRIDALVHAAGLEISHLLPDKPAAEYDLVFDVKADGWFNLLRAIGDLPLGATVVFSSIAGRFGNGGQTDYSAANDLLCKSTSALRSTHPHTRGVALDWTAWAGIGMASRGSIPTVMAAAGIDMLPPTAGVPVVRRELVAGTRGEVVVAGNLGMLTAERPGAGSIDAAVEHGPMTGTARATGLDGIRVETTLDPREQPFLDHHRIDGTAVLPGVMGIEAFAEAALAPLPGWHVAAVEDVEFLAPVKFYRDEPRTLTVEALHEPDGAGVKARCRLLGIRRLPNGDDQITEHFRGTVVLARTASSLPGAAPPSADGPAVERPDIYTVYFHGPAYRVLQRAVPAAGSGTALLAENLPADRVPAGAPLATAPRLLEAAFQATGVWELARHGRFALPARLRRVRFAEILEEPTGPLYAVVLPGDDGTFDAHIADESGTVLVALEGYETIELPGAVSGPALEPFRRAA
jgi:acyl transferase domain-containing protein/acyl carrier protein